MCAFTSDFDRQAAGFSPDRVDALVWALTELLVERKPGDGIIGWTRMMAEEARAAQRPPERPKPEPAKGSMEWERLHGAR